MKEVLRVGQWDSINWFLTDDDRFLPKGLRALLLTGGLRCVWAGWKRWLDWAKLEGSVRGNGPTKASRRTLFLARTSVTQFKAPPLL